MRLEAGIRLPRLVGSLCLLVGFIAACSPGSVQPPPDGGLLTVPAGEADGESVVAWPDTYREPPSPSAAPSPAPNSEPSPTQTPMPSPTLTPSPVPTPSPPPLLAASSGDGLGLMLQPLTSADTHIVAGVVTAAGTEPLYYFASLDRSIYAYDANGHRRWRVRMVGPVYALADLGGGEVAAADDIGTVTVLSPSGEQLWSYNLGTRVTALSGALPEGLLAGGWDERLSLLMVAPGDERILWQMEVGGRVTSIAAMPNLAAVSTAAGRVLAFDASGAALWDYHVGTLVHRLAAGVVLGGPARGQGIVMAGVQDGGLLVLGRDGTLLWKKDLGEGCPVWSLSRLGPEQDSVILAATGGGSPTLSLLSAAGEWIWRLPLPAPAGAVTALDFDSDGQCEIVVGLSDGRVLMYDQHGGLRAALQAGLSVWGLLPEGGGSGVGGLVLADLNAWRLVAGPGSPVKPRLRAPVTIENAPASLPPSAIQLKRKDDPRDGVVLAFLGDVVPGRSMEAQIDRYGPGYPWGEIGWLLSDADLVVANLECVLSTQGTPLNKLYVIRAHPGAAGTLAAAGIGVVSLANNHALDFGAEALDETLFVLERAGISAIGAGRTPENARRASMLAINDVRIALLAYAGDYWRGSPDMPDSDLVAWGDPESVADGVREARSHADVVVVVLHAGKEYSRTPTAAQVAAAHAAVDAGADLVVGHHPHVTQTIDRYEGALVVYSLGNALFDIQLQSAMQGDLLRVLVSREGLVQAELWPFWIGNELQPRFVADGQGAPALKAIYP